MSQSRLGELLVREKLISLQQLRKAQDEQKRSGQNLGYTLAKLGYMSDGEVTNFLSTQYRLPSINLDEYGDSFELLLSARDVSGSSWCAAPVPVEVATPPALGAISLSPDLFSPDADGNLDTTDIVFSVDQDVSTTVTVQAGTQTHTIFQGPASEGNVALPWDGLVAGGTPLADGAYLLRVRVTGACGMTAEACPLTPEEIRSWREEHLPYRLRHVDGLRWWLERLQAGKPPTVTVDGVVVHHKVLTNAVADAGLAACRALAELLGLATRRPSRSTISIGSKRGCPKPPSPPRSRCWWSGVEADWANVSATRCSDAARWR